MLLEFSVETINYVLVHLNYAEGSVIQCYLSLASSVRVRMIKMYTFVDFIMSTISK